MKHLCLTLAFKYIYKMDIKFIDLFAGVWWFHLALENLWAKCVAALEIDHPARKTYTNFYKEKDRELFEKNSLKPSKPFTHFATMLQNE